MRREDGRFEAIEVNLGNVALWWTTQFPSFRRNYARAVHQMLVEESGAAARPAHAAIRVRNWLWGAVKKPKVILREIQAARFRRRYAEELVSRHAAELRIQKPR